MSVPVHVSLEKAQNLLKNKLNDLGWNALPGSDRTTSYLLEFKALYEREIREPAVISAVVVAYKFNPDTAYCLSMLNLQRAPGLEIILVDNGSEQGALEGLYRFADCVVRLKRNTGAYLSRNIGSLFANGKVLLFVDDDGLPSPGFVRSHLEAHYTWDIDSARGVVQPKTGKPINRLAGHYSLGPSPYPVFSDVEGNVSYCASSFFAVGGWDDEITFGGGGVDLAIRLYRQFSDLRRQVYIPGPVLRHDYATNARHLTNKHSRQEPSRQRLRRIHPEYDQFLASWSELKGKSELIQRRSDPEVLPESDTNEHLARTIWPAFLYAYQKRVDKAEEAVASAQNRFGDHPEIELFRDAVQEILNRPEETWKNEQERQDEGVAWLKVAQHYLNQGRMNLALTALEAGEETVGLAELTEMRKALQEDLNARQATPYGSGQLPFLDTELYPEDKGQNGSEAVVEVSVLIPTYNRADFLALTVHSALMQSYRVAEVVVVDDGSTDNTPEIMSRFMDPRVRYVRKEHSGAPQTRNRALREAQSPWILWLDSDDFLLPGAVEQHIKTLQETPDAEVIYGDLMIVHDDLSPKKPLRYPDWYGNNGALLARLVQSNGIPNPGTMIRKDLFERYGPFDESFRRAHDYDWWARIAPTAKCKHTGAIIILWRWHDSNMSTGSVKFDTSFDARIVQGLAEKHPLTSLYPSLDWSPARKVESESIACLQTAVTLINLRDMKNGVDWLMRSWNTLPTKPARDIMDKLGVAPSSPQE